MKRKSDITYHEHHGRMVPAVNVKITGCYGLSRAIHAVTRDHGDGSGLFTQAWIDEHVGEDGGNGWWNEAIEHAWDQLQEDVNAEGVFGRDVAVYSEGRSGGWAIVDGITSDEVESWNAIDLARWRKFARFARETADDVPYQYFDLIYSNVFELWRDNRDTAQAHVDALKPNAIL